MYTRTPTSSNSRQQPPPGPEPPSRWELLTDTLITTLSQDNLYTLCYIFVQVLGVTLLLLCLLATTQLGGFGFTRALIFNFHPMLMTLGMIFLNANGRL